MKKIIAVDVDGTIVDIFSIWDDWLKKRGSSYKEISGKSGEELRYLGFDYLEFWQNPKLYDNLKPFKDAEEVINELKEDYHIVFVSSSFKEHEESKKRFLDKYFFYDAFISTSEKQFINCDYFIDDYNGYLDKVSSFNLSVECIKIKNAFNNENAKYPYMSWKEIRNYLKGQK